MLKMKRNGLKRMLAVLLTVMLCLSLMPMDDGVKVVKAEETKTLSSGDWRYTLINDGEEVEITDYKGSNENVVIPEELDGKKVTSIGYGAFAEYIDDCKLKSIKIPNSVTSIGEQAFARCSGLKSITIPEGVTTIEDYAFLNSGLNNITIPTSVTYIGYRGFYGTPWLKGQQAKNPLVIVNTIVIDGSKCKGAVTIPEGITLICDAFTECTALTSITLPESLTNIEGFAFDGCYNLKNIIIPDNVTSIGESAFSGCSSLTSITLPKGITFIDSDTFYGCSNLKNITIPEGVTNIYRCAFYGCTNLENITIPTSVTYIGWEAFHETAWLTNRQKENPIVVVNNIIINGSQCSGTVSIPNGIISFAVGAFEDCTNIIGITIPDSVTSIEDNAFKNCTSLTSITISDSVTSIGYMAFYNCTSLTSITIPDSVTCIGNSAFEDCNNLISITIPDNVTCIGNSAFCRCTSLTSITIPDSVTSIGDSAFYCCTSLTNITIPNGVTSIQEGTFSGCNNLASITIPDNVVYIYGYNYSYNHRYCNVFYNCPDDLIIYANIGSYAETWAKNNGYTTMPIASTTKPDETDKPNTDNKDDKPDTGNQSNNQNTANQAVNNQTISTNNQSTDTNDANSITNQKVTIPKVSKIKSFKATAKKKAFTISWKKVSGADGYELQASTKKSFKGAKTINLKKNKTSYKLTKLKAKKKYYIRIRAYKNYKDSNGKTKKAYGAYVSLNKKTK